MRERREAVAVVFDLGGTLLALDHPRIERAVRAAGGAPASGWVPRAESAARREVDRVVRAAGDPAAVWQAFFGPYLEAAGAAPGTQDAVRQELEAFHRRHHLWNRLVPGGRDMLEAVERAGYRLAALSNSDGRAERNLGRLGLGPEFEFVLDSAEVGCEKPDPRIFHLAARRLGVEPSACVYVGDVLSIDAEGACAAGFAAVLLDLYGTYRAEEMPDGVRRIVEPSQLVHGLAAPARAARPEERA